MLYYITIDDYCKLTYMIFYNILLFTQSHKSFLLWDCNILSRNVLPLQLLDQTFSKPNYTSSFTPCWFSTRQRLMVMACSPRNNILHLLIHLCFSCCQQHEWTFDIRTIPQNLCEDIMLFQTIKTFGLFFSPI